MSVRIIVDSSADVAERFQKRLCVVPLTIHFGSEELIDGVTIDKAHFYQRLVESDQLPTTSQATPAAFQKVYEQTVQAGDSAVVITLSGKLSGTYQSACIAAEEFDHVYVVDSQTAAIGTGILAEYALSCADAGMPADEIAAQLEQKREDVCLVALLDTLEYLKRAIAREGAEYGIYTYTICPSFIKTPLVEKQIPEQARDLGITEEEVVKNIMLRDTVDGVFTTVEDVANTLFFLSNDQGALTGQSLRLTHGWAMM